LYEEPRKLIFSLLTHRPPIVEGRFVPEAAIRLVFTTNWTLIFLTRPTLFPCPPPRPREVSLYARRRVSPPLRNRVHHNLTVAPGAINFFSLLFFNYDDMSFTRPPHTPFFSPPRPLFSFLLTNVRIVTLLPSSCAGRFLLPSLIFIPPLG